VRLRPVLAAAIVAIALAASRDARADATADLEKAHNAYVAHQYDEAEARLRALLDPQTGTLKDPDAVADARMYLGATLVAEKKNDEAAAEFALLLSDKPEYQPDALRVSLDAIDAFTDARARNRDKLAAIQAERVRKAQEEKARAELERQKAAVRLAMLERMAGTEVVTTQNSRLVALIPFGAGQFQNGQTALGWTFLVSEGLLAVGSGVGAAVWSYNLSQVDSNYSSGQTAVAQQYNQRAQTAAVVGDILAGGFALVAIIGVIHAEATFVPDETTTRPRAIPPVSVSPVVGPGGVGLVGSF
jgi:hypothetical protein